mgnify:FL=1
MYLNPVDYADKNHCHGVVLANDYIRLKSTSNDLLARVNIGMQKPAELNGNLIKVMKYPFIAKS